MHDARPIVNGAVLAVTATCIAISTIIFNAKFNKLTVTSVDFETMLGDPQYEQWFLSNVRCGQSTFTSLVEVLRVAMGNYAVRVSKHTFEKKVAVFLFFLGSQGGYRETAAAFGVSKSWCIDIVHHLSSCVSAMAKQWIYLPKSPSSWHDVECRFRSKRGLPGVVGAIDGTLIDIQRPRDYDGFYNRNSDPSVNVQAVVDARARFMSVDVRPGSYSDKKTWKVSTLAKSFRRLDPRGSYLIGDAGYTLFPWLITPFLPHAEGGKLTSAQKQFNFFHSSTRMAVECDFGRLKERFRILKSVMSESKLTRTVSHIISCMVLHNMFLEFNDELFSVPCSRRDRNHYFQPNEDTDVEPNQILRAIALRRRNALAKIDQE